MTGTLDEHDATEGGGGPIGSGDYVVTSGDCIESIAVAHGFFWETIWKDAANAQLRGQRRDPNVLLPGDQLAIPALREREEDRRTRLRHRYRRRGVPSLLRIRLLDGSEGRAKLGYRLEVDGEWFSGTTDADGRISQRISPSARRARLVLENDEDDEKEEYFFQLGKIDPVSEVTGAQARLASLGFYGGAVDGDLGPHTRSALRRFQVKHDIEATGRLDAATRDKLAEVYGC